MNHQQEQVAGYGDRMLFRQRWIPDGEPKAVILLVHGMAEHSGRYHRLVDYLLPRGYAIYTFDHPGHGRSEGRRCHVDSFREFSENLQQMLQWVKVEQAEKPLILFGHSMGGLIVADYLASFPGQVDAAILSAPALKTVGRPSTLQKLKVILLKGLRPQTAFRRLDLRGLSRDPEVIRAYRADPLVHTGSMSIGLALALGQAMAQVANNAKNISLPLLIVQGGQDTMVDPQGAESFHAAVSSGDKHLQIYPDAYHEILNEPEAGEFLELMADWLEARVAAGV